MRFRHSVALALLAFAVSGATTPGTALVSQARVLLNKGDVAGATAAVERAVAIEPRNADALVLGGNLVRDRYGLLPALPWYDRALAVKPAHEDALFEKAATLGDAGRARPMLAVSRQLLAVSPNNPKAFYLQAVMAARAGKWDLARGLIYRIGKRMDSVPGLLLLRGTVTLEAGANDEAIASLRGLMNLQPSNAKARRLLGLALTRVGDRAGAIDVLRPLAEQGDSYALTLIGRAFEAMDNRTEAATALDHASGALVWTPEAAILTALDEFLSANPDNVNAQRLAADRALSRGEWDGAAALYASLATRLGGQDPVRLSNAGWAEIGREQPDRAADYGAAAYVLAPMNAVVTASYGSFLARAGRKEKAVALLEKAVSMAPDQPRFAQELAAARKRP
jgi:cellulose synthase operon protein C